MRSAQLLLDAFGRIHDIVHHVIDGAEPGVLSFRPDRDANSIEWLVWHLSRIEDDHIADAAGIAQVWVAKGWSDRFGLPFEPSATGYGHQSEDVAAVQVGGELLIAYFDAVHEQTSRYVEALKDDDFDRVVDDSWDPPVTLGVRLVSVVSDCLEHAGQAAFIRGIAERG
jgi:Protein of unknown function (DUF664)